MRLTISFFALVAVLGAVGFEANAASGPLDHMPPTWDQILGPMDRFRPALLGGAVLDEETGLVWLQRPLEVQQHVTSTVATNHTVVGGFVWADAVEACYDLSAGGRKGWRLPTVEELMSLVDPARHSPALPAGHPFSNIGPPYILFWTATTTARNTSSAYAVQLGSDGHISQCAKDNCYFLVLCVRGGHGPDSR